MAPLIIPVYVTYSAFANDFSHSHNIFLLGVVIVSEQGTGLHSCVLRYEIDMNKEYRGPSY